MVTKDLRLSDFLTIPACIAATNRRLKTNQHFYHIN